jgi:glycosyltransferase involved in cell wall biosynthesis
MKILFIISRFYPFIGGFEYHAYQLAEKLAKKGHEVTVLTTDSLVKAPKTETIHGIRIIRKKSYGMVPFTRIPISPGIYSLPKEDFDVVNVFGCIPMISDLTLFFAKQRKLKTVYTHIFDPIGNESIHKSLVYRLYKNFARFFVKKYADNIVTWTKDYAENSDIISGMRNIKVIPSGVDKSIFYPLSQKDKLALKRKYNIEDKKVLLFVGRLDSYKGVKYLIDALNYLPDKKGIMLLIAGDGTERKSLEKQAAENNLRNYVTFLGNVSQKNAAELFNISDVFILPSINRQEAFGKVNIEAMACGAPVIATNLLGVREVVKGAGIIVEAKDSEKLAKAVEKILSDKKLSGKFSKIGIRKVKELYDWENIVQKTVDLYKSL